MSRYRDHGGGIAGEQFRTMDGVNLTLARHRLSFSDDGISNESQIISDFSAAVVIFVENSENQNSRPRCQGVFESR